MTVHFASKQDGLLSRRWRIITALMLRETSSRFGRSAFGIGWALLEPAIFILVWATTIYVFQRQPPVGESRLVFVAAGFFPYLLFRNLANHMAGAIRSNRNILHFPLVSNLDLLASRCLLELGTFGGLAVFYFTLFGLMGLEAMPAAPDEMFICLGAIALLGTGVGACNAIMTAYIDSWAKIYRWLQHAIFMSASVFYLPSSLPPWFLDIIAYNPMLHGVEWARAAFFAGYSSNVLSQFYLLCCGVFLTTLAILCERALRRSLSVPR